MAVAGPVHDELIVLGTIRLGESSKIVSGLSRGHGRVKLVAKGARTLRSRWATLLEPGNELTTIFYPHEDRQLWMLSDAQLVRAALTGAQGLDKLSHLLAALELADRLLPEREPLPELEGLYRGFLDRWHRGDAEVMSALFFALELGLLQMMGLGLDGRRCASCGRPLLGEEGQASRARFEVAEGTLDCPRCALAGGRWLEADALRALAALQELDLTVTAAPATEELPRLSPQQRRDVGRLLHEHMGFHLSHYRIPKALYWVAAGREDRGSPA